MKEKDVLGLIRRIVDFPLEMLGVLCDLTEKLASEVSHEWLVELKKFLRKEKCWTGVGKLLESYSKVIIPATTEKFVVKEKFIVNIARKDSVKISFIGNNFSKWFLGKIEESVTETAVCYAKLTKFSVDGSILIELGNSAEMAISQIYWLILQQPKGPKGENGALLTNGYSNIFYVRDVRNVLCDVHVRWYAYGWRVSAYPVVLPHAWGNGDRIFFRNSCSA